MSEMKISLCNGDTKHVWLDFFKILKHEYNPKNENIYVQLHEKFLQQHGKKWISIFDDMEFWGTPNQNWNSYRPNISSLSYIWSS